MRISLADDGSKVLQRLARPSHYRHLKGHNSARYHHPSSEIHYHFQLSRLCPISPAILGNLVSSIKIPKSGALLPLLLWSFMRSSLIEALGYLVILTACRHPGKGTQGDRFYRRAGRSDADGCRRPLRKSADHVGQNRSADPSLAMAHTTPCRFLDAADGVKTVVQLPLVIFSNLIPICT